MNKNVIINGDLHHELRFWAAYKRMTVKDAVELAIRRMMKHTPVNDADKKGFSVIDQTGKE